jgi:prepilin-type N-terminal cleavage/methylation domain-containing protein/prepilin-type processing-associated H-X9-DG protein
MSTKRKCHLLIFSRTGVRKTLFRKADLAGLTLIELLVVIAILGILAALLFATLGSMNDSAKASKCAGNLKQIGVAFGLYLADNGNVFPGIQQTGDNSVFKFGGKNGAAPPYRRPPRNRPINEYIWDGEEPIPDDAEMPVFHCPADTGSGTFAYGSDEPTTYDRTGTSYAWNSHSLNPDINTLWGSPRGRSLLEVKYPSRTILASDFTIRNFYAGQDRGMAWHRSGTGETYANILFVDGHVAMHPVGPGNTTENYTFLLDPDEE